MAVCKSVCSFLCFVLHTIICFSKNNNACLTYLSSSFPAARRDAIFACLLSATFSIRSCSVSDYHRSFFLCHWSASYAHALSSFSDVCRELVDYSCFDSLFFMRYIVKINISMWLFNGIRKLCYNNSRKIGISCRRIVWGNEKWFW